MRHWVPSLIGTSIFAINQQVAIYFASGLAEGSGSALTNALVFWQLPFGILGVSVITVLFPRMSRHADQGDTLARLVETGLLRLSILLLPALLLLIFLAPESIAATLQRGAFSLENSQQTANVLRWYALGLFSVGGFNFMQRFFYAMQRYRPPTVIAAITVAIDILLSIWLKETSLQVAGLALANSIAFTVGLATLLIAAKKILPNLNAFRFWHAQKRLLPVLATITAAGIAYKLFSPQWWSQGSTIRNVAILCLVGSAAIAIILSLYKKLGLFALLKESPPKEPNAK